MRAAEACFFESGYERTTVRAIAAKAGASIGTVMGVGDKPALLVEVFDTRIASIQHSASTPPGSAPRELPHRGGEAGPGAAERCVELVAPFVRLFVEHTELSRHYAAILVSGAYRSETFGSLADLLRGAFREMLAADGEFISGRDADARLDRAESALYFAYLGVLFASSGRQGALDAGPILEQLRCAFAAIAEPREGR